MTRRLKLILVIQNFLSGEAVHNADKFDSVRMGHYVHAIQNLERRVPKMVTVRPRVTSQRKLF